MLRDWSPRDIVAHLIGWKRGILVGCAELREGVAPYCPQDGPNDYRTPNAGFIHRFSAREPETLLADLTTSLAALSSFLGTVRDDEWDADSGVVHYRGGSTTGSRCVEWLMSDCRNHCQEILQARLLRARNGPAYPGAAMDKGAPGRAVHRQVLLGRVPCPARVL